MSDNCLFCRIVAGEIPSRQAYSDERVIAFHDVDPQAPTHVLIVPRQHIATVDDMGPDDGELFGAMIAAGRTVARAVGADASGYRLVFNHGRDAAQSVAHVHMHLLAGRPLAWPPG